jgi:hypothetical protein
MTTPPLTSTSAPRRAFDWMFCDRETGRIVIAEVPNLPLVLFFVAAAVRRFAHVRGGAGTALAVVAFVALMWWAVDEIVRGVSPFRRGLGAVVALASIAALLLR